MCIAVPEMSASQVMSAFHRDSPYLFLGAAFVAVGIVAAAFAALRRRRDSVNSQEDKLVVRTEKAGVGGSTPSLATNAFTLSLAGNSSQQLNFAERPPFCDRSVTSADVRLASASVVTVSEILLQLSAYLLWSVYCCGRRNRALGLRDYFTYTAMPPHFRG
jgi:hypothetical protein